MKLRLLTFNAAAIALLSIFSFGSDVSKLPKPPKTTIAAITPTELREHLAFLASDELGGRYTLSPNFPVAARYLATRLQAYGYKPAGDNGSYFQHFELISSKPKPEQCAVTLTSGGRSTALHFGEFITADAKDGLAEGAIIFVGYGISSAAQHHDDYAGLDVKGKIVLLVPGAPKDVDESRLADGEQGEAAARAHGAIGVLSLPSRRFLRFMKNPNFMQMAAQRSSVRLAKTVEGTLPSVMLGPDATDKLPAGLSFDQLMDAADKGESLMPKALDATAKIQVTVDSTRQTSQNVVGILDGTDPKLKNEYVTFSAHYDHLQTNAAGQIYPGADDDGSGTTSVLTIAHALAANPPRRSVLIIFHAGEELGLLGSRYNTDFAPVVPLDKVVVDLNIDMIGRSKPAGDTDDKDKNLTDGNTVYLVGADRISKELNQISEDTNTQFEHMKLDYLYNDPKNPERIYYRSDHWNYAKHGIPIIFYFDGTHVDYHQPTDTIDKIDFNKMTKIARLVLETGWRLANMDQRLVIDKQ